jgi:uncharacterized membrane protein (DUF106 family)
MKNMIKHRLFLPIVMMLISWVGFGFQTYLVYRNHVLREQITNAARRLDEAKQQVEKADRRLKQDTEELERLLKMLPPKPVPDFKSKL